MLHGTAVTDTVPPFQRTLLVVGLALAVPFVLYETLLLSGTIPPLDQEQGGAVVEALILYAFAGGIVTIVGGFALAFCQRGSTRESWPGPRRNSRPGLSS
jgi:hypothetical protein